MKNAIITIAIFAGFAAVIFGLTALDYGSLIFWAPKYENANRTIFENTKSFRDGSSRDLNNLRVSYLTAQTPDEKAAIKDVMRHRSMGVPAEQISPEVNAIINGN